MVCQVTDGDRDTSATAAAGTTSKFRCRIHGPSVDSTPQITEGAFTTSTKWTGALYSVNIELGVLGGAVWVELGNEQSAPQQRIVERKV